MQKYAFSVRKRKEKMLFKFFFREKLAFMENFSYL